MDAIVLVGGQGTRLRPLTDSRHKSLVPVINRPAIAYLFDWLRASGMERAVLALGQNNEDLAEAFPPGDYDGLEVVIVRETERLESGGAIRNAVRGAGIEGRFAVLNGDVFVEFDFRDALAAHEKLQADLTLALYEMDDPSQFGVAVLDADRMVTGFVEKPPPGTAPGKLVNAGVWIFEPRLVDEIPPGAVRVEETLFPSLVGRRRRVLGYEFGGLWADIGTWQRYRALNCAMLAQGRSGIAPGAHIDPAADVRGSAIGPGASIGAGAVVEGSVLWSGVRVETGAVVRGSVIADDVVVGARARIEGAVIGRGAVIASKAVVPAGRSIESGGRYDADNEQ
jgi:mannose-1-phosphate guanylyltransferase